MKKILTTVIVAFSALAVYGAVASLCYNAIAWEFNLPRLNYWVITGTLYVLNGIKKGISASLKIEE